MPSRAHAISASPAGHEFYLVSFDCGITYTWVMADFNDSELFSVFEKGEPSKAAKKKGAPPLKRKKAAQSTPSDSPGNSTCSKRAKKSSESATKPKPEVVVINDTSDEEPTVKRSTQLISENVVPQESTDG